MKRLERLIAWAGGALFVAALAVTAWWYVWALGRADEPSGSPVVSLLEDAAIFSLFACHHSAFARGAVKAALAELVPERMLRSLYVWVASILLLAVPALWRPIGVTLYHAAPWPARFLTVVQLAGLWLIAWSVAAIDPLELAGIRPSRSEALQIAGPYRLVRHPLYLGWMLSLFGTPHMTGDRLAFAVISSTYLVIAIPWEERSLGLAFGEAYTRYTRLVRWRVLPYVY